MLIKLKCINDQCFYSYEVTQKEFMDNSQYHKNCLICGSILVVTNLPEIIAEDWIERSLEKSFKEIGIEATIEFVEKRKDQPIYKWYKRALENRGFKLKE